MATIEERVAALEAQLQSITTPSHAEVVNRMVTVLQQWQTREEQLRDWLGGAGDGGPNGDGKYPLSDSTGFTQLVPSPVRMVAEGMLMSSVTITASTTLTMAHNGKRIRCMNTSAITITCQNGMPADFNCIINRVNTGTVTLAAASPATLSNDQSLTRLRARYSACALWVDQVLNGNSLYISSGSMVQT